MKYKVGDKLKNIKYPDEPAIIESVEVDAYRISIFSKGDYKPSMYLWWTQEELDRYWVLDKETIWNNEIKDIINEV